MKQRVDPTAGLPFSAILPFFLLSPLGMVAAGLLLARSDDSAFLAVNLPRTVAATHALVLGWLTTAMMGATLQLSPAVLGGPITAVRTVRLLPFLHAAGLTLFTWSLLEWDTAWMSAGGALLVLSLGVFVVIAAGSLSRGRVWSAPRIYALTALGFLVATFVFGITVVGALHHLWFPITLGRLAAHAHLGLGGWLALMVMGLSYQLVPMFNVIRVRGITVPLIVLGISVAGLLVFFGLILSDPARPARVASAAVLAVGPVAWAVHQAWLLRHRARRALGVHAWGTYLSLAWLTVAIVLGLASAAISSDEPARLPLAYGAALIVGWLGTTLITNSFKIVPFLVWYHRYRSRIGEVPVPLLDDIAGPYDAAFVLLLVSLAAALLVAGALAGSLALLATGSVALAAAGGVHLLAMLRMLLPRQSTRAPLTSARRPG